MSEESTRETYERAGFGARVPRGERPAVVVVDLSRGFTEPAFTSGADLTEVVAATAAVTDAARAIGAPVVYTVIAFDDVDDAGASAWLRKAPGLAILRPGSEAVELDPRLGRRREEPVVVKKGASAFFGTPLAAMLAAQGVDTVIVCGATTSGCVRATVVDAVQSGFNVVVPRECVGDRAEAPHDANLFDIDAKYGDVVSLGDARAYLSSLRETAGAV
jgi:nicotinamidase-related amidase